MFFDAVFASAIAACFIPVFSEYLEKRGREEAFRFAGQFITAVALLTGGLTLLGMALPGPMVALFADYADPQTTALATSLTRVMFPTVFFSGVGLLPGGGAPGPGPLHRPRPHVHGVQSGHHRLLFHL